MGYMFDRCDNCIHWNDCWMLGAENCAERMPIDEYIESGRDAFRYEFFEYLYSFESD